MRVARLDTTCGHVGQRCCKGRCNIVGTKCIGGRCRWVCGKRNAPCCSGRRCNSPMVCLNGRCKSKPRPKQYCGRTGQRCCRKGRMPIPNHCHGRLLCFRGRCVVKKPPCGNLGQLCCDRVRCNRGLMCRKARCQRKLLNCGSLGRQCCPGNKCGRNLRCIRGTCRKVTGLSAIRSCGARGKRCCPGNRCSAGLKCNAGKCQTDPAALGAKFRVRYRKLMDAFNKVARVCRNPKCKCYRQVGIVRGLLSSYAGAFRTALRTAGTPGGKSSLQKFKAVAKQLQRAFTAMQRCARYSNISYEFTPMDSGAVNLVGGDAMATPGSLSFDLNRFGFSPPGGSPW